MLRHASLGYTLGFLGLLALVVLAWSVPGVAGTSPASTTVPGTVEGASSGLSSFSDAMAAHHELPALTTPRDAIPPSHAILPPTPAKSTGKAVPAAGFSAPVYVSTSTAGDQNGGPTFAYSTSPSTVTDAAGYVWTAWSADVSGRWTIWFAYSSNDGGAFSTPVQLDSAFTTQDTSPDLTIYGSGSTAHVAVVWENRTSATDEPETTDGYTVAVSLNGGSTWTTEGGESWVPVDGYGPLDEKEGATAAWDDSGNLLITFWAYFEDCATWTAWKSCTVVAVDGWTGGTSYCPTSGTDDGCWLLEAITSSTGEYWPQTSMACSSTATDCSLVASWTNGDTATSTDYVHTFYSTKDYNTAYTSGAGSPQGPSTVTSTAFDGTAGLASILVLPDEIAYVAGNDTLLTFELNAAASSAPSFDVAYYYHTGATNTYTAGNSPTGSASTTGTSSAAIAGNPSTDAPFISYVDSSNNIDATWSSSMSGAFLATPDVVVAGGALSATSIAVTTVAGSSPFRIDIVYLDNEDPSSQVYYSNFFGLYGSAGITPPSTVDLWQTVSFTSSPGAGASPYTYAWSFAAQATCAGGCAVQNPVANFTAAGKYTVTVTITDTVGESVTVSAGTVTVNPQLLVAISPASASVDSGQSLTFTATPSGGSGTYSASGYVWKVNGVAQASTTSTMSSTFTTAGTTMVSVTATDSIPWTSTPAFAAILVDAPLTLGAITATPNPVVPGGTVTFSDTPSGGTSPYTYAWSLGGGTTSAAASPTNSYASGGTVKIWLNVTDAATGTPAASASASMTLVVDSTMTVGAAAAPTSPLAGQTVFFNGTASGGTGTYAFSWVFGDVTAAAGQKVTHAYSAAGTYTATLFVNDSAGQMKTATVTVTVLNDLSITASAAPNPGTTGSPVDFQSTVTGGLSPYVYAWAFGDGATASTPSPSTTYSTAGTYSVSLTVTDTAGHTATKTFTETVNNPGGTGGLTVGLTANPSEVQVGTAVSFDATVSGGDNLYELSWHFGDGAMAGPSSALTQTHAYGAVGTYTVTLIVNDSSTPVNTGKQTTTVTVCSVCFTASLSTPNARPDQGETVSFTGSASGGTGTYSVFNFVFGDGTTQSVPVSGSATQESVTHAYARSGTYIVNVTVLDTATPAQEASASLSILVNLPVTVVLRAPTTSVDAGLNTIYTAHATNGSGTYTSYLWVFGVGTTSIQGSTEQGYTFAKAGVEEIEVTVTDTSQGQGSAFLNITVNAPLEVSASGDENNQPPPMCVVLLATVNGGASPYTYTWNFGDGSPTVVTTNASWTHCYTSPGLYDAQVSVTDAIGGSNTAWVNSTVSQRSASGVIGSLGNWWWLVVVAIAVAALLLFVMLRRRKPRQEPTPEAEMYAAGGGMVVGGAVMGMDAGGAVAGPVDAFAPAVPPGSSDQSPDDMGGMMDGPQATPAPTAALPSGGLVAAPVPPHVPACPRCGSGLMGEGLPCPNCQYVATPEEVAAAAAGASIGAAAAVPSISAPSPETLSHCPQCSGPLRPDNSCPTCQVRWEPSAASVGGSGIGVLPSPSASSASTPVVAPQGPATELTHCPQCGTVLSAGRVCTKCQVSWEPHAQSPGSLAEGSAAAAGASTSAPSEAFPVPPPPVATEVRRDGSMVVASSSSLPSPLIAPSASPAPSAPAAAPSAPLEPPSPPTPAPARPIDVPAPMALIPATQSASAAPTGSSRTRCFICDGPVENGYCSTCNMSWSD